MNNVVNHRRALHQIPELSYQEFKTKAYIISILKQCNCEIIEVLATGVCAYFNKGKKNTMAFRADMDALPIKEETLLPFSSQHANKMHACGHDNHMAILLGFAEELSTLDDTAFENNILLVFQPSEETVGGAKPLCESGIFEKTNTKAITGIHVYPFVDKAVIASRALELMACASEVTITITGKSTHCAQAKMGIDPIEVGAKLLLKLYEMEKNEITIEHYRLVKFGLFQAGTVRNIIPDTCQLEGTIRSFSQAVFDFIITRVKEIIKELEDEFGCTIDFSYTEGYPPLINDACLYGDIKSMLCEEFIFEELDEPLMIAEDFSFYCKKMPGCFLFLGTGKDIALHNSKFDVNEAILSTGIQAYLKLMNVDLNKHNSK